MTKDQQPGSLSRRERLKQEREERILTAAAAVFARKGFHRATIREIAQEADVADGTIYNYFDNKRDLLVAITRHVIAQSTSSALAQGHERGDRDYLTAILKNRLDFARDNLDFIRVVLSQAWTDTSFRMQYLEEVIEPMLTTMEGYLTSRMQTGRWRDVDSRVATRAMVGGFLVFIMLVRDGGDGDLLQSLPSEKLAGELADFFLLGLQADGERGEAL